MNDAGGSQRKKKHRAIVPKSCHRVLIRAKQLAGTRPSVPKVFQPCSPSFCQSVSQVPRPVNLRKLLAARFFGLCEQICLGQFVPPRGTPNLERADLVNFIRAQERERLT